MNGELAPVVVSLGLFITTGAVLIFRGPLGRALARRIEGSAGVPAALEGRLGELEDRVAQVEHERDELVERLDFAERMLLQVREGPKELPR